MTDRSVLDAVNREIDQVPNRSGDLQTVIEQGRKHRRARIARITSVTLVLASLVVVGIVSLARQPDPTSTPVASGTIDHSEFMVKCLSAAGVTATGFPGSDRVDIEQFDVEQDTLSRIIVDCRLRSGAFEMAEVSYVRELHTFLVELHACLESEGYPVPQLISAEEFIEGRAQWHPYDRIWESSGTEITPELQRAADDCPNNPDAPAFND